MSLKIKNNLFHSFFFLVLFFPAVLPAVETYEINSVPFVRQDTQFCGPAALSSVFAYYGTAIDQHTIARAVYTEKLDGALITDMKKYAEATGFKAIFSQATADDIKGHIAAGRPVIALLDFGIWLVSQPHYIVIIGSDGTGFIAHTGYEAKKHIPYAEFQKKWAKLGSVLLVVYR